MKRLFYILALTVIAMRCFAQTDPRADLPPVNIKASNVDTRTAPVKDVEDKQDYSKLKAIRDLALTGDKAALVSYVEQLAMLSKSSDISSVIKELQK